MRPASSPVLPALIAPGQGTAPRCASGTGIETPIGYHSFRATGITDYHTNGVGASRSLSAWPGTPTRKPGASMIGATMTSAWGKWSGSGFDGASGGPDHFLANRIQQFLFPTWSRSRLALVLHTVGLVVENIFQKVRFPRRQNHYNLALLH